MKAKMKKLEQFSSLQMEHSCPFAEVEFAILPENREAGVFTGKSFDIISYHDPQLARSARRLIGTYFSYDRPAPGRCSLKNKNSLLY